MMSIRTAAVTLSLLMTACTPGSAPAPSVASETPGTVTLNESPPSDLLYGGSGTGTLAFHGGLVHFRIAGVGVDGAAIAVLQTTGEAFHLADLASFAGIYRKAPQDAAIRGGAGGLWLQNVRGTVLHLAVPPQGRMPDIGTDAVQIILAQ